MLKLRAAGALAHRPAASGEPQGAAAVYGPAQRLALLIGVALLVALRLPHAWWHGRFLDEEGSVFFAYAWHRPTWDALFRSFGGYLNLAANGVTLLDARLVQGGLLPLELAPYLTMIVALLFQLVPAVLLLTARAAWLANRWAVAAALLIPAIGAATEEVFLNTLHIQFHLALAAALILALDVPESRRARVGYGAVLLLAPLCGPGAIILLPFFVLRSLVEREPARWVQTAVLGLGTAVQLLVFFHASPVRGDMLDPATLAAIGFVRLVLLPFIGFGRANRMGRVIHDSYVAGGALWWCAVAGAALYFGALAVLAVRRRRDPALWLVLPALGVAAASFGGGMIASDSRDWFSVGAGERYNFVPLALSGMALVVLARRPGRWLRRICTTLLVVMLVLAAFRYPKPIRELRRGPDWAAEVAVWRGDHDHPLVAWPRNWAVDLSDPDRPCGPPRLSEAGFADPSYCESFWLARTARQIAATKAKNKVTR